MNTGSEDCLSYRDLARQGARISRSIDITELRRLYSLMDPGPSAEAGMDSSTDPGRTPAAEAGSTVAVELDFRLDDEGYPWVEGRAATVLNLLCNRCAENVEFPLSARFALCIVTDESLADTLADSRDLLEVAGPTISIAEIVEDELLLALPERLCLEDPCSRMPGLFYPAAEAAGRSGRAAEPGTIEAQTESDEQENPFAVLESLKTELRKENEKG